jgi:hypothetical protein
MTGNTEDKKCCTHNDLNSEGISLLTRFLPVLDPVNAPVDPRDTQDILVFAKHYADLVRYYDLNDPIDWVDFENGIVTRPCNEPPGLLPDDHLSQPQQQKKQLPVKYVPPTTNEITTWKEFFYKDIAVVVASISQWGKKLWLIKKEYNNIRKEIEGNPTKENYRELYLSIIHHLKRIDRWYRRSVDEHPLKTELEVKIKSFLAPALKQLISYDKGMVLNVADDLDLVTHYVTFEDEPWNAFFSKVDADDSVYVGNNLKQKIIYSLMYVDDIFNTMCKAYEEITQRSGYYWQQAIEEFPRHQPHMALFISFVELFSYARNELNGLIRKHLEFFYRDVLHLKEKPASPDSVYLIYQLAKGVDEFDLKEGTKLTAGKDALGKQLIYKTDKELVINKAIVKELKTLFLDKSSPVKNIYAAPVANSADGKGEKFKDPETAWPTFGYFEPREEGDKITGEKAKFGFAIASPQFLLSGGERTILLRIKFKKVQATTAAIANKLHRLSNDSFKVQFSGEKEWILPENQTEEPLTDEKKINEFIYPSERERILNFINSAKKAADIAGVEHQDGPVFDNPAKDTSGDPKFEDYDFGDDVADRLVKRAAANPFTNISSLLDIAGLDQDKVSDLIYSFSDQYIGWNSKTDELYIKATIHTKQDPIVAYNNETLKDNFATTLPVCKVEFSGTPDLYAQFEDATIQSVGIFVRVTGLTDLVAENDDGPIDPAKSSFILTARPQVGSSFSIGSPEFVGKKLNHLIISGEWVGEMDFAGRYKLYGDKRDDPASYTCSVDIFYDNEWHPVEHDLIPKGASSKALKVRLFYSKAGKALKILRINIPGSEALSRAEATEAINAQIIKFTLNSPDFGHDDFPVITVRQLANRLNEKGEPVVQNTVGAAAEPDLSKVYTPKAPITPQVKSLNVDYTSSQILTNPNGQVFHIYPFGQTEIFPYPLTSVDDKPLINHFDKLMLREEDTKQLIIPTSFLLPQFKFGGEEKSIKEIKALNKFVSSRYDEFKKKNYFQLNQYRSVQDQQGNLYIGIENLAPPQNLSLLFKFADGSAYDNDSVPPKINWSYLVNNEWLHLSQDHIITDSTYGFQTTGIILFDFPSDATNNNTIVTSGLHWLCASVESHADRIPKLIDVIAQANQATFFDQQNDQAHYKNPLPEKKISKPLVKIPEVKAIVQPFESFDGKPGEEGNQFYQHVSERLRHKGRAITPSDYEHLLLEQFPSVYKVKVLSHTDPECLCRDTKDIVPAIKKVCCCPQPAPGHLLVIAISNLRNKNAIDLLKPRTGRRTLLKIEEFLKKRVSPFVHVHARNPKFEEVKVGFNVKFYTGIDKGFYLKKLNDDIIRYLTPWAYDSNFEILFGNKIYASKIIDYIEDLGYVDYISCFRMIHLAEGCCEEDSLPDLECSEMHADLSKMEKNAKDDLASLFINEVSAKSSQAILVSAKQHCIELIEDESSAYDCNCTGDQKKKKI